jgi:hypothetical protein
MKELLRLHAEGGLTPEQSILFENQRPPEELYDCEKDPHHLNNLAANPDYQQILVKMRNVLDQWQTETGDMGFISEQDMLSVWYPSGIRPTTAPVHFVPNTPGNRNEKTITEGEIDGPATLSFYCATQGASMAYTFEEGPDADWEIYNGPIRLKPGENYIRAKAIRYGYYHSEETTCFVRLL